MATAAFKAVLDLRDQSIQAELCKAVEQAFSSADGVASTATMTKHILKFRIGHQDAMQGLRSPDAANDQRWSSQCLALV